MRLCPQLDILRIDMPVCTACTVRTFTECHIALPYGVPRLVPATAET